MDEDGITEDGFVAEDQEGSGLDDGSARDLSLIHI